MESYRETALACIAEVETVISKVDETDLDRTAQALTKARRIFVSGEGRSGLMGKAIAMRLMHANYSVFVTGETITPSISEGDLLLLISGSASGTESFIEKANKAGAQVVLVTANPEIQKQEGQHTLFIPAATKYRKAHEPETIQPLGNQFDQSVHLLLDAIIVKLVAGEQETMRARHANLE
ncbi:6-phospho-3-hexuloisomerase [Alkalicoccobacillus porphyridii]|uniref:SIS domain-containing protein n=1 Tax=Alkalicoccobacillus porphyridii TaxID=2597270 RepID=A0A554A2A0_9BACI|nr:6-phospho-3-hexuloisomerase [Alkalicoccobacillus porphyridii]TSB47819.1 SIS domain-containing protein [Alkalicoccobacillus porphyridii]